MAETEISSLQVRITSDIAKASEAFEALRKSLIGLKSAVAGLNLAPLKQELASIRNMNISRVAKDMERLANAATKFSAVSSRVSDAASAARNLAAGSAAGKAAKKAAVIPGVGTKSAAIGEIDAQYEHLSGVFQNLSARAKALQAQMASVARTKGVDSDKYLKLDGQLLSLNGRLENTAKKMAALEDKRAGLEGISESARQAADSVQRLGRAAEKTKAGASSIKNANKTISRFSSGIKKAIGHFKGFGSAITGVGGKITSIRKRFERLGKVLDSKNGIFGVFSKFSGMLKRIAIYRVMRSIVSAIGSSTKSGFENLARYSSSANAALSELSSTGMYLGNSLAAALAPALRAIIPLLQQLASWAITAFNAINMFFSALGGATTYTRATKANSNYAASLDKVGGAAAAAKKSLLGFDELNMLSDAGGGGGGGGAAISYSDMFETAKIGINFAEMWRKADFTEAGAALADKLNDALSKVNWTGAKAMAARIGRSLATAINGFFLGNGLESAGLNPAIVGSAISGVFNTAFMALLTFMDTLNLREIGGKIAQILMNAIKGISGRQLGNVLSAKFQLIIQFGIGFLKGMEWSVVGAFLSDLFRGFFEGLKGLPELASALADSISETINGLTITKDEVSTATQTITGAIVNLFTGIDPAALLGAAGDVVLGIIRGITQSIQIARSTGKFRELGTKVNEALAEIDWKEIGKSIWELLKAGIGALKDVVLNLDIKNIMPILNIGAPLLFMSLLKTALVAKMASAGWAFTGVKIAIPIMAALNLVASFGEILQDIAGGEDFRESMKDFVSKLVGGIAGAAVGVAVGATGWQLVLTISIGIMLAPVFKGFGEFIAEKNNEMIDKSLFNQWAQKNVLRGSNVGETIQKAFQLPTVKVDAKDVSLADSLKEKIANAVEKVKDLEFKSEIVSNTINAVKGIWENWKMGSKTAKITLEGIITPSAQKVLDSLNDGGGTKSYKVSKNKNFKVAAAASGGIFGAGTLILAGESGNEILGRVGTQTGVKNDRQISDVFSEKMEQNSGGSGLTADALANAMVRAMVAQGFGAIYLDGKQLNQSSNRATKRAGRLALNI